VHRADHAAKASAQYKTGERVAVTVLVKVQTRDKEFRRHSQFLPGAGGSVAGGGTSAFACGLGLKGN